ncbi:MAG: hypothetical protein HC822_08965 [Oscillochloris sp.]|nr:hypothetical protein [Oscillochloris sp.]
MAEHLSAEELENQLRTAASRFPYPPTPDLVRALRGRRIDQRRRPWLRRPISAALGALLLILGMLLAVPDVRAAAFRWLQIGVVRVWPAPVATPTADPSLLRLPALSGAISLDAATRQAPFPILLPTYPGDLGLPSVAFLQHLDGQVLVLVWAEPSDPGRVRMSLHLLGSQVSAEKMLFAGGAELLAEVEVNGERALWVDGPHVLRVEEPDRGILTPVRLVEGNTLIWSVDAVTYRLETDLPLEEARRIAESLQPIAP